MSNFLTADLTPETSFKASVVAKLIGASGTHISQWISVGSFPEQAYYKVGRYYMVYAFAVPMFSFMSNSGHKLGYAMRHELFEAMAAYTRENWEEICKQPKQAEGWEYNTGHLSIAAGGDIASAVKETLKFHAIVSRFVSTPDVQEGRAILPGSQHNVYEVVRRLEATDMNTVLKEFPDYTREDVQAAAVYVDFYPRRGRPRGAKNKSVEEKLQAVKQRVEGV